MAVFILPCFAENVNITCHFLRRRFLNFNKQAKNITQKEEINSDIGEKTVLFVRLKVGSNKKGG